MHRRPCLLHVQNLRIPMLLLLLSASSTSASIGDGEFTFDGFFGNDLIMDGEATVSEGLLRLTTGQNKLIGHAFYPYPLDFTSAVILNGSFVPSFSTTFVFAIIGPYPDLSAHGLAFVLSSTKESLFHALPSQYLGLFYGWFSNASTNLAIELDTIQNPEFQDIDDNHIGVDINSLTSAQSHTAGYYTPDGEFHPLKLISKEPMQVWVDYDSNHARLNVTIAPYSLASTKPSRPLLSYAYNISTDSLAKQMYVGFSSATGTIESKHYILGWSFKLNGEAAPLNYSALSVKRIQELAQQVHAPPHSYHTILWIILLPTVAVSILAGGILVKVYMKRQRQARTDLEWRQEYGPPSFTYKDLLVATNGFKDKMLLGTGGFGNVYKGVLPVSKQTVAIKRVSPDSKQGLKEFMAEIVILGHVRHRKLVQLLGYCRHKQQLILVYDYMPNRSLDSYLHSQDHSTTDLCWAQRFHIIKGIASGLFYLHEDWEQVVIHRDVKTSNVLLDGEMNARLGDFGLARSHDHGADAHTTRVAGTWGYIAPELARLGKATKATDVFALGVLMMEVACGKRPIWVNNHGEPLALGDWVLDAWRSGFITHAVDPRLDGYVDEEVELVLKLGLLCSHPSPNVRPCMRLVMQYLQRDAHLPSDLEPKRLLNIGLVQDEMHDQHAMSCPATVITDLSKGR